jgi:hypothetical protein
MELVEDGALGQVQEAHIWFRRGGPDRDALPKGNEPVPEGLNWDLWLGPLAWREFHRDWMSYSSWRENCNGGLGVFGMHAGIFPFMTLGLRALWNDPKAIIRKSNILASFDNGGPLSEMIMLGNIATLFPRETVCYDPVAGRITGHAEANQRLSYPYREGWRL